MEQPQQQPRWMDAAPTPLLLLAVSTPSQADSVSSSAEAASSAAAAAAASAAAASATAASASAAVEAASSSAATPAAAGAWRCTFINRAARRLIGIAAETVDAAAAFSARIHTADRSVLLQRNEDGSGSDGDGWHCSFRMQIADGSFVPVRIDANTAPVDPAAAAASTAAESTCIASLQLLPPAPVAAAASHRRSRSFSQHSTHVLTSPPFPRGSPSPVSAAAVLRFPEEASVPLSRASASPKQLPASPQPLPPLPAVSPVVAAPSVVSSISNAPSVDFIFDAALQQSSSSPPPSLDGRVASDSSGGGARPTITPLVVPFAPSLGHASAMTISTSRALPLSPLHLSPEMQLSLADDMWTSLPVMLMLVHASRILRVSPKFTEILGWDAGEVRSMHVAQLFHPEDVANISLDSVRITGGAYKQDAADTAAAAEDADPAAQSTDTVVINRLRHKHTGEYVSCMFRTALSRRFFAVPAVSVAAAGPLVASRGSTPRSVDATSTAPSRFAEMFNSSGVSVDSSAAEPSSQPPRLSLPSASVSVSSVSPASTPVAEPYIHALIRPMYKQERAALSNALEGIAQSKAAFISNITHELQTPMNGIVASAELLGETQLTAEQTDCLNCIQISAEHMSTIIGDIVSFASIESGSLQLERAPVHLNAVIEESVTLVFRPRLHDHLEVLHSLAPDLPAIVLGDSARLRQILIHLVSNALKFTRKGEIVIRVSRYDGSSSPANLIRRQTEHLQALADELASGRMDPEAAAAAEAELNAPQMLVIQPPQTLPSLFNSNQQQQPQTQPTHHQLSSSPPPLPASSSDGVPIVDPLPAAALALTPVPLPSPPLDDHEAEGSPISAGISSSIVTNSPSPSPSLTAAAAISPTSAGVDGVASLISPVDDRAPFLLQFAISDTGCGIDPRHATRLFQIFSPGDPSSSKEHQGTGIGLLTSLKLCRAQGGEVWCSSVAGRGSTFYFTVLCTPAAPVSQPTPLHANGTLQTLSAAPNTIIAPPLSSTPTPMETVAPLLHVSASSAQPPPQSQPLMLSTHTTPLARVRNLVEQENSLHRRSSTDSSVASASASSSSSSTASHPPAPPPASFDSPGGSSTASTNSPHRSPLVFPRFIPTFQTVCVVHTNAAVLAVLSEDLRARGALVRTFSSPAQALVFAQSQSLTAPAIDCWIIDSLSGTMLCDESNPTSTLSATSFAPNNLSGVELVARLLELRETRERARSTAALRSDKVSLGESEVRVVLFVQSFGLPPTLPLPESVLTSPSIRLIQVHKPVKHQVLYDAIRTLGEQISLPFSPVQRGAGTGHNSLDRSAGGSLSSTSSGNGSASSGYAMSLTQAKSRRTLTLAMHMGSGPAGASVVAGSGDAGSGASSTAWATRRVAINQNRGSVASSSRSIGHERELVSSAPASFAAAESPVHPRSTFVPAPLSLGAHEVFVPTGHYIGSNSSSSNDGGSSSSLNSTLLSPILPPSPFVHQLGPFASSSDSSLSFPTMAAQGQTQAVAVAPVVVLPLPRPPLSAARRSRGGKGIAGNLAAVAAGAGAGPAAAAVALRPPSHHSPRISTGSSRLRGASHPAASSSSAAAVAPTADSSAAPAAAAAPGAAASDGSVVLAHKYPLRILCADDVAINLKICLKILTKLGYHADSAVDGLEAHTKVLAAAREVKLALEHGAPLPVGHGAYDLVLMDLQMPLCDGFEASEIIIRAFGCCNLPVSGARCIHHMPSIAQSWCATLPSAVAEHKASAGCCASPPALTGSAPELAGIPRPVLFALTANTTEDDKSRCFKVGFDGFIAKPVSVKAIVEPLKKWAKAIAQQRKTMQQQQPQQPDGAGAASETGIDSPAAAPSASASSSFDSSANSASRLALSVETSVPHRRVRSAGLLSPTAELGRNGEEVELPSPNADSANAGASASGSVVTEPTEAPPRAMRTPSLHALKSLDALRQIDLSCSSSTSSRESSPQLRPRAIQRAASQVRETSHSDGTTPAELDRTHSVPTTAATAGSFSLLPPISPRTTMRPATAGSSSSSASAASSAAPAPVANSSSARQLTRHLPPSSRVLSSQKSPLLLHTAAPAPPPTLVESLYLAPALTLVDPPTEGPLATRVRVSPPVERKKPPVKALSLMHAGAHALSGEAGVGESDSPASRMQQGRAASDAAGTNGSQAASAPSTPKAVATSSSSSSASATAAGSKQAFLLDLAHK